MAWAHRATHAKAKTKVLPVDECTAPRSADASSGTDTRRAK